MTPARPVCLTAAMTEHERRTAILAANGIPEETAAIMVAYELSHARSTSTLTETGMRVKS